MKKIFPAVVVLLLAMVLWNTLVAPPELVFHLDDGDFGGPLGSVFGALLAGSGLLIAALVVILVGALLTVMFAGLGLLLIGALALGAVALAAALSPLMLPLLLPLAIYWMLRRRAQRGAPAALPAA